MHLVNCRVFNYHAYNLVLVHADVSNFVVVNVHYGGKGLAGGYCPDACGFCVKAFGVLADESGVRRNNSFFNGFLPALGNKLLV